MFHSITRFFLVWHTLVKYGVDTLIPRTRLHFIVSLLTHLLPIGWTRKLDDSSAVRLRKALEELGPIYVKFGQAISTRPDLLPPEMAFELAKLQDDVPPFPREQAVAIIEKSLKQSVDEAFARFDDEVLASASIAQVHTGQLHSGEEIVVKVARPGMAKTIRSDLGLMYLFAYFINSISGEAKRLRLPEVIEEFDKTIFNELDLTQEAANAGTLRQNFLDSDILYVPKVYWDYCRKDMLVMERIYGVPINDIETLNKHRVNFKKLAAHGVTIFFTQVFYHKYFHADMHPGNIFVDINDPENPKYIAIDFGIMASLDDDDQYYLAENFLAFFNRDYRRVAQLHIDSGWVPETVKVTDFEAAIRKASEPIFGKPLKDISFAQFLLTLFQTARRYEMEVQPQLVLLQKTFFNIEGLGRVLYPDLDLWDTGKPILEKWMKDQFGPKAVYNKLQSHAGEYAQIFTELPILVEKNLKNNEKSRSHDHHRLTDSVLLGFVLLTLSQQDLWGAPLSRYALSGLAVFLVWKLWHKR